MSNPTWTNAKGQKADPTLTAPDLAICQARPNMLKWSPFTLGPKPVPVRCTNRARFVAVENKPGDDGRIGSMGLCGDCVALLRQHRGPTFARIHPLTEPDHAGVFTDHQDDKAARDRPPAGSKHRHVRDKRR
jgi:hypothetical protein